MGQDSAKGVKGYLGGVMLGAPLCQWIGLSWQDVGVPSLGLEWAMIITAYGSALVAVVGILYYWGSGVKLWEISAKSKKDLQTDGPLDRLRTPADLSSLDLQVGRWIDPQKTASTPGSDDWTGDSPQTHGLVSRSTNHSK